MRLADLQATKAENLINHESEILSRPKRTWFQSFKTKQQVATRAKQEALGELREEEEPPQAAKGAKQGRDKKAKAKGEKRGTGLEET